MFSSGSSSLCPKALCRPRHHSTFYWIEPCFCRLQLSSSRHPGSAATIKSYFGRACCKVDWLPACGSSFCQSKSEMLCFDCSNPGDCRKCDCSSCLSRKNYSHLRQWLLRFFASCCQRSVRARLPTLWFWCQTNWFYRWLYLICDCSRLSENHYWPSLEDQIDRCSLDFALYRLTCPCELRFDKLDSVFLWYYFDKLVSYSMTRCSLWRECTYFGNHFHCCLKLKCLCLKVFLVPILF